MLEQLNSGKYNKAWIARQLYPNLSAKSAKAKFHNKLNELCYTKLTDDEVKKIKELIK